MESVLQTLAPFFHKKSGLGDMLLSELMGFPCDSRTALKSK